MTIDKAIKTINKYLVTKNNISYIKKTDLQKLDLLIAINLLTTINHEDITLIDGKLIYND